MSTAMANAYMEYMLVKGLYTGFLVVFMVIMIWAIWWYAKNK